MNCPPSGAGRLLNQLGLEETEGAGPGGPSPVLSGTFEGKKGTPLAGPRGQGSSRGRSVPALRPALLCLRGAGQDLAFSCRGR